MAAPGRILNIDLDGVIYPWHEVFADWCGELKSTGPSAGFNFFPVWEDGKTHPYTEPTTWDFWDQWGMSEGEWINAFRRGVEYGYIWTEGSPIAGAADFLWKLSDDSHYIRLVTHRLVHKFGHRLAVNATADWLDRWNIPYRDLVFMSDKNDLTADVVVDDKPETVVSAGPEVGILFNRKWNQGFNTAPVFRAKGWRQVYETIKQTDDPFSMPVLRSETTGRVFGDYERSPDESSRVEYERGFPCSGGADLSDNVSEPTEGREGGLPLVPKTERVCSIRGCTLHDKEWC